MKVFCIVVKKNNQPKGFFQRKPGVLGRTQNKQFADTYTNDKMGALLRTVHKLRSIYGEDGWKFYIDLF